MTTGKWEKDVIPRLDAFRHMDEEIGTVALVVLGRDKMIEPNKSDTEIFSLGILKPRKY
jgi:hypothetical protein